MRVCGLSFGFRGLGIGVWGLKLESEEGDVDEQFPHEEPLKIEQQPPTPLLSP